MRSLRKRGVVEVDPSENFDTTIHSEASISGQILCRGGADPDHPCHRLSQQCGQITLSYFKKSAAGECQALGTPFRSDDNDKL